MKIIPFIVVLVFITAGTSAQNFTQFSKLTEQADSAWTAKNYQLGLDYYEQALALPDHLKPELFGSLYYNMACLYSLNKQKDKSLYYLQKSFEVSNAKKKVNPVAISHIASDSDL